MQRVQTLLLWNSQRTHQEVQICKKTKTFYRIRKVAATLKKNRKRIRIKDKARDSGRAGAQVQGAAKVEARAEDVARAEEKATEAAGDHKSYTRFFR
jgi:hypothetical protein